VLLIDLIVGSFVCFGFVPYRLNSYVTLRSLYPN
jgi:hypothetical protein